MNKEEINNQFFCFVSLDIPYVKKRNKKKERNANVLFDSEGVNNSKSCLEFEDIRCDTKENVVQTWNACQSPVFVAKYKHQHKIKSTTQS